MDRERRFWLFLFAISCATFVGGMLAYVRLKLNHKSSVGPGPVIYFVADYGIIGSVSLGTLETHTVINISVFLQGITYDPANDQLYFSGISPLTHNNIQRESYIYRASPTAGFNAFEIVFSTTECKFIRDFA